jgi:hypothetical protein
MGITSSDGVSDSAAAQERETTAGEQKMLWVARRKVNAPGKYVSNLFRNVPFLTSLEMSLFF